MKQGEAVGLDTVTGALALQESTPEALEKARERDLKKNYTNKKRKGNPDVESLRSATVSRTTLSPAACTATAVPTVTPTDVFPISDNRPAQTIRRINTILTRVGLPQNSSPSLAAEKQTAPQLLPAGTSGKNLRT